MYEGIQRSEDPWGGRLIAVTDGLKGMAKALAVVYPDTTLQTCIVHLIRNSLDYASWKERKALAAAIKPIYKAASQTAGAPVPRLIQINNRNRSGPIISSGLFLGLLSEMHRL